MCYIDNLMEYAKSNVRTMIKEINMILKSLYINLICNVGIMQSYLENLTNKLIFQIIVEKYFILF